ncbi:pro-sigmaK processing inhibitor BofA family protein [Aureibacillus halotolerans]|uniref:Inhibitor of the pro-sigma K processing machinery n=1 Tax=Aureibacillus halotolerans TaxID=1508390 RepID=A0A4R6U1P8_9BACI|nr:pro-sigmaK processing inhibitor BofA family protein [Aureibacillus halotolerans]TDQ38265.1 inhibitor of the pro-sigma K processing machinery [Aureibacillus halotolerans]
MDPIWFLVLVPIVIVFLFWQRGAALVIGFAGKSIVKVLIGALFLFFLNTFFGHLGINVPINLATAALSGFLGLPGVAALAAVSYFLI